MLGDELGGLIEQLPRGLIVMTCTAGLLWVLLLVYFAAIRPARARRRNAVSTAAAAAENPTYNPLPTPEPVMPAAELPDLDMLMGAADDEPDFDVAPAAAPRPAAAANARRLGTADVRLADGEMVHAREALLVLRDPRDGQLIVQVDDTGYKSLDGPYSPRARVEALLREVGILLGAEQRPAGPPPQAAPQSSVAPPSPTGTGAMPGDLPRYSELKDEIVSRGAFRPHKTERAAVPELNIPAAIEAYLQYSKSFTPEFAQRSIHVLPAIGGGVRIEVDGTYYDGVNDVADADVRAFLQATIQEWQKRQ
jgi:hypothetical protein